MKKTIAVLAALVALPLVARAQKPMNETQTKEITTKIEAIDHTSRRVTLKHADGELETIRCGPEVKRFAELKVGDTITFRFIESTAYTIRKPGQTSGQPEASDRTLTAGTGPKPGGTIAEQKTASVTIKAIDMKVPSVTVLTADGHRVSFKVDNKKNLEGVQVGDTVEITYTEAVMISIK